MEYKFDAFISYRHAEVDSAVAKDIQHWLEHFHVPKAIQKTSGKRKINRVFRDKEELPLSMNLGETITDALIHSEYLIVICSPRTQESQWVQREIETFLETHDLEHILVVIADGEPDNIIPKMLTYKETTSVNENGEEITVKEDLEPLGCDYRVGKRKAHKEELPRLAASLLHCSYDDLIQRARQYRTRVISGILATVLALALGILGYVLYSNQQIKTNYENALRKQSEYLASESIKSYENFDRSTAIALALEALPSETNDRPYVAKAEFALGSALGVYNAFYSPSKADTFRPSATYSLNTRLVDGRTDNGPYVALLDESNTINVFNSVTDQFENRFQIDSKSTSLQLVGIAHEKLLICNYGPHVCCYSIPEGKMVWSWISPEKYINSLTNITLIEEEVYLESNNSIYRLNAKTGDLIKEYPIPSFPEGISGMKETDVNGVRDFGEVSNNHLPFFVGAHMDDGYASSIPAILDLETGSISYYPQGNRYVYKVSITDQGDLLFISDDWEGCLDIIPGFRTMENHSTYVSCIDPVTKQTIWEVEENCVSSPSFYSIKNVTYTNVDSRVIDATAACFGDNILIIDSSDGTILKKGEAPGLLVSVEYLKDSIACVTRNGDFYLVELRQDEGDCSFEVFPSSIDNAKIKFGGKAGKGILINRSKSVTMFKHNSDDCFNDGSWKSIDVEDVNVQEDVKIDKNKYLLNDSLIDDNVIVFLFDDCLLYSNADSKPKLKCIDLKEYVNDDYANNGFKSILGVLSNQHILIASDLSKSYSTEEPIPIVEIDLESEKVQKYEISESSELDSVSSIGDFHLIDDTLFYVKTKHEDGLSGNHHLILCNNTYGDKELKHIDLGLINNKFFGEDVLIDPEKKMAAIFLYSNGESASEHHIVVKIVDLLNGTYADLKLDNKSNIYNLEAECALHVKDGSTLLAIAEDHSISIWNENGERIGDISISEGQVKGMHFFEDGSLAYCVDTGKTLDLIQCGKDYSKALHRLQIPVTTYSDEITDWVLLSDHYLACIFKRGGAAIIDSEQWQFIAFVPGAHGYQNKFDRFICKQYEGDEPQFGYRKRYTTESLIAKAKEVLGNYKLTDSQRAEYGLQ